jgi:hypothetical protein
VNRQIAYCIVFFTFNCFAQTKQTVDFLSVGATNYIVGLNQGSHPNLENSKLNVYTSLESAFLLKGVPLQLSTRYSTEQFLSGKSTYFRLAYNGLTQKAINKKEIEQQLLQLNTDMATAQDSIYLLEAKIAYLEMKKAQLENKPYGPLATVQVPTNPSIPIDPNLPTTTVPASTEFISIDSMSQSIDAYSNTIHQLTAITDSLSSVKQQYIQKLNSMNNKIPNDWFSGIDKCDIGFTNIGHGGMSNNTIAIQGLHVKGAYKNTVYEAAAGTTVTNRILTNSVYDQVMNNNQNIFNLNQFFTVNSTRFVSSLIYGIGKVNRNNISLENYYNGNEVSNLFSKKEENKVPNTNLTTNLAGNWIISEKWSWNAAVGKTFNFSDSLKTKSNQELAVFMATKYQFPRWKSDAYARFKQIGIGYDGFSQGLYNAGFTKSEMGWNTRLSKKWQFQIAAIHQEFSAQNKQYRGMATTAATVDFQWSTRRKIIVFGGYTLLKAHGYDSLAFGFNHSGKGGFSKIKELKRGRSEITGFSAWSHVNRIDSTINMVNANLRASIERKYLTFGLQVSYQEFQGVANVQGTNWIIKPEFKCKYKGVSAAIALQFLNSQQFGKQNGLNCKLTASPSKNSTWEFNAIKWLPTEALYIPNHDTLKYVPFYVDIKLRVFLNQTK